MIQGKRWFDLAVNSVPHILGNQKMTSDQAQLLLIEKLGTDPIGVRVILQEAFKRHPEKLKNIEIIHRAL